MHLLHFLHRSQRRFQRRLMRSTRLVGKTGELFFDPPIERCMDGSPRRAEITCDGGGCPAFGMEFNDGESALSWISHVFEQREATCRAGWLRAIGKGQLNGLRGGPSTKLRIHNSSNFIDMMLWILRMQIYNGLTHGRRKGSFIELGDWWR